MSGDGDGWVFCDGGHRHWGLYGAAGLLISDGEHAILQHRAPWTHEGGTWGLPGGARDSHEDAMSTALREAYEEAAIAPSSVEPVAMWVDDHGGWSYTTVLARPTTAIAPRAANAESTDVRWWDHDEVDRLPLHRGLAATWPRLRYAPPPLLIVVDARAHGDSADQTAQIEQLIRDGVPTAALPKSLDGGQVTSFLPRVSVVGSADGAAIDTGSTGDPAAPWWTRAYAAVAAGPDAGAAVLLAAMSEAPSQVVIITTDEAVLTGVQAPAVALDPLWFRELLAPRF